MDSEKNQAALSSETFDDIPEIIFSFLSQMKYLTPLEEITLKDLQEKKSHFCPDDANNSIPVIEAGLDEDETESQRTSRRRSPDPLNSKNRDEEFQSSDDALETNCGGYWEETVRCYTAQRSIYCALFDELQENQLSKEEKENLGEKVDELRKTLRKIESNILEALKSPASEGYILLHITDLKGNSVLYNDELERREFLSELEPVFDLSSQNQSDSYHIL